MVDGIVVFFVDKGGKRLVTFPAADDADVAATAAGALLVVARRQRAKLLRIEKIDGEPARSSSFAELLTEASFKSDPRGLTLEA